MIAGQQSLGKTTLAQQLVAHKIGVRTSPFLGLPVAPAQGVHLIGGWMLR